MAVHTSSFEARLPRSRLGQIKALDYQLTANTRDRARGKTNYRMHSATFRIWERYRPMLQFLHKYHARR